MDSTGIVFIAGNNEQFGNWQPDQIKLEWVRDHWEKTFSFEENTWVEFKFTKGSWESEALDENGNIQDNHSIQIINDTTLAYQVNLWKDGSIEVELKRTNYWESGLS